MHDAEDESALLLVPVPRKDKEFLEKAEVVAGVDVLATQNAVAVMCLPPLREAIAMQAMIAILAVKFFESLSSGMWCKNKYFGLYFFSLSTLCLDVFVCKKAILNSVNHHQTLSSIDVDQTVLKDE